MGQQLDLLSADIVVRCLRIDKRLRVVAEKPFLPLFCAFPRSLRREGAFYRVAGLRLVRGRYYRAIGPIAVVTDPTTGAGHE